MIKVRKANDRGIANLGWLNSRHTFSFGDYFDPEQMGFGPLRVINEDKVKPAAGFDTHGHRDMEIISYVLDGALEHKDSIGNGSVICPGDVQRMSAGSGILHSEFNYLKENPVHFLQIWIEPNQKDLQPSYEQKHFENKELHNQLRLVASSDGRNNSVTINQDAFLYVSKLEQGQVLNYELAVDRGLWIQVANGSIVLNEQTLLAGDGAAIQEEAKIIIEAKENSEILLFDLVVNSD